MDNQQKQEKFVKPQVELLPKLFSNYKIDPKVLSEFRKNLNGFRKDWATLLSFVLEVRLDNNDIDYWMDKLSPKRNENESYNEMKIRTNFQNLLIKYRSKLYDYPNKEKKISNKRAKLFKKQLGII